MASIVTNGFSHILPSQIPRHIQVNRELEEIVRGLDDIHREWIDIGPVDGTSTEVKRVAESTSQLRDKYMKILRDCEEELKKAVAVSINQQDYYYPLLEFLSRANDAHSILPFSKYIFSYRIDSLPPGTSREEFHDFIGLRMSEAILTCRSYQTLLAQTLNAPIKEVDINNIVQKAFRIAQQRSRINCEYFDADRYDKVFDQVCEELRGNGIQPNKALVKSDDRIVETLQSFAIVNGERRQFFARSQVQTEKYDNIYSIEPLLFFYLVNTIGNHFKASYEYFFKINEGGFEDLPLVDVRIMTSPNHVAVITHDNGIGMPEEGLSCLFSGEKRIQTYSHPNGIEGNGRTLHVFPMVADLLGAHIIASSRGPYKGSGFALIIPNNLENPHDVPERFISQVKGYL